MADQSILEARIRRCEEILHRRANLAARARAMFQEDTTRHSWENDEEYIERLHSQWENRYKQTLHVHDHVNDGRTLSAPDIVIGSRSAVPDNMKWENDFIASFTASTPTPKPKWWQNDWVDCAKGVALFFGWIWVGFCVILVTASFMYLACGGK